MARLTRASSFSPTMRVDYGTRNPAPLRSSSPLVPIGPSTHGSSPWVPLGPSTPRSSPWVPIGPRAHRIHRRHRPFPYRPGRSHAVWSATAGPQITGIGRPRWGQGNEFVQIIYGSGLAQMTSAHVGTSFDESMVGAYNSPQVGHDSMMVVRGGGSVFPYNPLPHPIRLSGNPLLYLAYSWKNGGGYWSFDASQIG